MLLRLVDTALAWLQNLDGLIDTLTKSARAIPASLRAVEQN